MTATKYGITKIACRMAEAVLLLSSLRTDSPKAKAITQKRKVATMCDAGLLIFILHPGLFVASNAHVQPRCCRSEAEATTSAEMRGRASSFNPNHSSGCMARARDTVSACVTGSYYQPGISKNDHTQ